MIAAQVALFVLLWQLPTGEVAETLRTFGLRPTAVHGVWAGVAEDGMRALVARSPGQVLRQGVLPVISYAFLHTSVVAVLVNAFFLLTFGREVEGRSGALALCCLFAAGMVAGAAMHVAWNPKETVPACGAAAAVSALIGACLVRDGRSNVLMAVPVLIVPVVLTLPVLVVVGAWFVLQLEPLQQLLAIGECEPLSWPAVVAGFGAGAALSPLCLRRHKQADKDWRTTRADKRPTRRPSSSKGK